MEALHVLPNLAELPPRLLGFLEGNFKSHEDLSRAPALATELRKNCIDLERNLISLQRNLSSLVTSWTSHSNGVKSSLHHITIKSRNFDLYPSQDGMMGKVGLKKIRKILREELPLLAKEVRRVEIVRIYAETTLKLESLVGDLEDAVFYFMNQNTRNMFSAKLSKALSPTDCGQKPEKMLLAIKAMNNIEEVLVRVSKCQPQWGHLLKAVDTRVDKTLAVLRPQALADHRFLLSSIGWPPPLLTSEQESEKISSLPNPLVLMQGDKKSKYCESFLALCALQHMQARREKRQYNLLEHKMDNSLDLWTIDELVSLIASRMEHHFSKWSEQPKFLFALVYRITRDFVEGVDDVLQPLIDKAMLVGYSAKEAWVSAMVKMLSGYLSKKTFSVLAVRYKDRNGKSEVISSWLHLVDHIIAFDKRMQSLATLGTPNNVGDSGGCHGILTGISILSIFCDQPDWLRIWAKIELKDAQEKLKVELEDERAWTTEKKQKSEFLTVQETEPFLLSTREDHKAPLIAESVIKITWAMIERSQSLPSISLRVQFIRSSAVRFLWHFLNLLLQHHKEAEFTDGYAENDALVRISGSINAARYCESILRDWSEDVNFLEMTMAEDDPNIQAKDGLYDQTCFFGEEIKSLIELETDWLMEIMGDLLQQFNNLTWEYVQNREQWGQEREGHLTVSGKFTEALDALRSQFSVLKVSLNSKDFFDLWRCIADGLDHFIFSSIFTSDARFSVLGASQFGTDMQALFLVFKPFCARPEAFFPRIRDSLKLLEMGEEHVKHLTDVSNDAKNTKRLQIVDIGHISHDQARRILRNRNFGA